MTFTTKNWIDSPSTATPVSAAALEDLETRLAAYTDAQVAIANANTWTAQHARMRSSAAQTIPGTSTFVKVVFDQVLEDYNDGDAICDTPNDQLIIPTSGMWNIAGVVAYNNTGAGNQITGVRILDIKVGTAGATLLARDIRPMQNLSLYLFPTRTYYLAAGSLITAWTWASVTASDSVFTTANVTQLECTYLGPIP